MLIGLPIAIVTFAVAWVGIYLVLRSRTPRDRDRDGNPGAL